MVREIRRVPSVNVMTQITLGAVLGALERLVNEHTTVRASDAARVASLAKTMRIMASNKRRARR